MNITVKSMKITFMASLIWQSPIWMGTVIEYES